MRDRIVQVVTAGAWVVLATRPILPNSVFHVGSAWSPFVLVVVVVGSSAVVRQWQHLPIEEVFDAGREYQRRIDMKAYNRPFVTHTEPHEPGTIAYLPNS